MRFNRKKKNAAQAEAKKNKPYDKREPIKALSCVFTVMNRGQSSFYVQAYQEAGASVSLSLYGYSMPPEEYRHILGIDSTKKEILITVVRTEYVPKLLKIASDRFSISPASKGIAFACPIDSVGGIAIYRFLADQNQETRVSGNGK